ncbi:coiled-coil domain-containing protein 120 isoform X2 [Erpetoichthys calabaricus]|uniref:Coiled-coil domain containing 120b n=1 Tax=Erpetoichthys calabaricus TaxID=27687 RepID=A0A8C4TAR8_ERPCA|nr:coiled-coil domain-containing protein 120 isoform X2 [Erpetoichthys calabaricus]
MEVKGHLITPAGLSCSESQSSELATKLRAERMIELLDRKRTLQAALTSRISELKKLCLQEAELTGELPSEYPLESGERPPNVRRRTGVAYRTSNNGNAKGESSRLEELEKKFLLQQQIVEAARKLAVSGELSADQRRKRKTVLAGALRRLQELEDLINEQRLQQGRKPTQRVSSIIQDDSLHSENSSLSDSTSHENDDPPGLKNSSALPDRLSPPKCRADSSSPDRRACRKLSPVEIYYEMKTRRNSVASSASPTRSLPRSASNMEGRSVPATPQLPRMAAQNSKQIRADVQGPLRQWTDMPDSSKEEISPTLESFERAGCPYSARTRRSNSSEALLDRSSFPEAGKPGLIGKGMGTRGPFKSSETLTDGKLRQPYRSPERYNGNSHPEQGRVRASVGGRATYNEILLDYVLEKQMQQQQQQQQQQQHQQQQQCARSWLDVQPGSPTPSQFNGCHYSRLAQHEFTPSPTNPHFGSNLNSFGLGSCSPMIRSKESRRVKVTRTKSCGPFIPVQQYQHSQQDALLLSEFSQSSPQVPEVPRRGFPPPDECSRNLHKALALEGLRDWYIRNALGHAAAQSRSIRGPDMPQRRAPHQPQGPAQQYQCPPEQYCRSPQLSQSVTFHGHPLHGRHLELSLYRDSFHHQVEDLSLQDPATDTPSPGTLV